MFRGAKINWRTTLAGLLGVALLVASDQGLEVVMFQNWGEVVGYLMFAFGLSQSRDWNRSTEEQR